MASSIARFIIVPACAYLLFCLLAYLFQEKLLYFPGRWQQPDAASLQALGLTAWPEGGQDCRGYLAATADKTARATVVIFHGNAGPAWLRSHYLSPLLNLEYRVLLAEYPGYGGRQGKRNERSLVTDARQTLEMVNREWPGPVHLFGESLGAGVAAAALCGQELKIDSLVLITPWDSLGDLATALYPYLPVRLLLRDRYDNLKNLSASRIRTLLVLAERDEIIPRKHSMRLFEALPGEKKLLSVPAAGHNDWPDKIGPEFWRQLHGFISQH